MKQLEIAKQWARASRLSPAEAADQLEGVVRQILEQLRKKGEAPLPGMGKLRRRAGKLVFESEEGKRRA